MERWMKQWGKTYTLILVLVFIAVTSGNILHCEIASAETIQLNVLLSPFLSFAPFFIAEEEGFFVEQGLDMNYTKLNLMSSSVPLLAQGKLDIAAGILQVGLFNVMAKGLSMKIVADKGSLPVDGCPSYAVAVRKELYDSGQLNTPDHLRGLRVAIEPVSFKAYFIDTALASFGMTIDDVEIKNIPYAEIAPAFRSNAIDMAFTPEPWTTRIIQNGSGVVWKGVQEILPDQALAVVFYGARLLGEDRTAGNRFMVAYLKAIRQYNQGKTPRNIEILSKHTSLSPELLHAMCWPAIRHDGSVNLEGITAFQNWSVQQGFLDKAATTDQFWDGGFLDHAIQVLEQEKKE